MKGAKGRPQRTLFSDGLFGAVQKLLFDWDYFYILATLLLVGEGLLCALVIYKIPYTEIDWRAYMQEVEGPFVRNEWNYTNLKGDTGPLVYPAGFVYLYEGLRRVVNWTPVTELIEPGQASVAIQRGQWIFMGVYLCGQATVLGIYNQARPSQVPPYVAIVLCLSKRIHSIFVLRLFNDGVAMVLFYLALLLFMKYRWTAGCVFFSLAVSVKMNVLLFAPALFLLLLRATGWAGAIYNIAVCGIIQLLLGLPFMLTDFWAYINGSFEFGRVFKFKWTVNWKFLPEEVFVSKSLALSLLALHLTVLGLFASQRWTKKHGSIIGVLQRAIQGGERQRLSPEYILTTMLTCNFIGVVFCRSLHYQFYCWYWHAIPYLLWQNGSLPYVIRALVVVGLEWTWGYNFPATPLSSATLHVCHVILLMSLWLAPSPPVHTKEKQ
jgi:alpha-1,3-mannosyltransferase